MVALLMVVLIGMAALAVDVGWLMMTKTQLQSSSDSGSLAGGTELLPGLGFDAYKTPAEVDAAAKVQAVDFVSKHVAAEAASTHIESGRDVQLGKASLNVETGVWTFQWGVQPYNAIGVTTQRSDVGTNDGDRQLPLIFARILGADFSNVTASSVAVVLPASGIRLVPGSGMSSGLSPLAYRVHRWQKFKRAQRYFDSKNGWTADNLTEANGGHTIMDDGLGGDGQMLFYEAVEVGNSGVFENRILFDDQYGVDRSASAPNNITNIGDGKLEANIYPLASEAGNFGTVDIGGLDNSTAVISRQISDGISEADLADFENNALTPSPGDPIWLQGDTGISGGIEAAIEDVIGQCKAILIYTETNHLPGNTALFKIEDIIGTRFMAVNLHGGDKILVIQRCNVHLGGGVPNYDEEIGDETTVFTPLILAN